MNTMRLKVIAFFLISIISNLSSATSFVPVSIETQITEASAIVLGQYLGKKSEQLSDGQIVTYFTFALNKEMGIGAKDWDMEEVKVHVPGGQVGDLVTKVDGVPSFYAGEKVVLFLKESEGRFWLQNLALGAYGVVKFGDKIVMNNRVFPNHPDVGNVNFAEFERLVQKISGSALVNVQHKDFDPQMGNSRSIASVSFQKENIPKKEQFHVMWLVAFFALIVGAWIIRQKKSF